MSSPASDTAMLLAPPERRLCGCLPRSLAVGLVVVLVMASAQTASSELTRVGLANLEAPFFTMWLHTSFMLLVLPITATLQALGCVPRERATSWRSVLYDDSLASTGEPPTSRLAYMPPLVARAACFYVLWVAANYCYARALVFASAGLVTAVFSSCRSLRLPLRTPLLVLLTEC